MIKDYREYCFTWRYINYHTLGRHAANSSWAAATWFSAGNNIPVATQISGRESINDERFCNQLETTCRNLGAVTRDIIISRRLGEQGAISARTQNGLLVTAASELTTHRLRADTWCWWWARLRTMIGWYFDAAAAAVAMMMSTVQRADLPFTAQRHNPDDQPTNDAYQTENGEPWGSKHGAKF